MASTHEVNHDGKITQKKDRRGSHNCSRPLIEVGAEPVSQVTGMEIARRAYDLYLARGCEHGHDLDDWLQAERELQDARSSTAA
jgi:hypothetical protein